MDWKKVFMLCQSTTEEESKNFADTDYQAQIKYDGERIIAVIIDKEVILINRRGKICNLHFQEIVEDLKVLPNCIIDGEIISLDDDFSKLMKRAMTKTPSKLIPLQTEVPIKYMVFDVLGIGKATNKINLPLRDRITELNGLFHGLEFKHTEIAKYGNIPNMLIQAHEEKREGLIIKNLNALYEGRRSEGWKKLKFFQETTLIVTKFTENPKGIRVEDDKGNACQIAGEQCNEVKEKINSNGSAEIYIQYLTQNTETHRFRFPSYRGLIKEKNDI